MYRGCCIEWDCLMMHRIKSVAFSWAPLSFSHTLPPSPLPLSHSPFPSSFLPSPFSSLSAFKYHPPPRLHYHTHLPPSPSDTGCLGLLATRCSVLCCLTPSITAKGKERVQGGCVGWVGVLKKKKKKKRIEDMVVEKWAGWKHTLAGEDLF